MKINVSSVLVMAVVVVSVLVGYFSYLSVQSSGENPGPLANNTVVTVETLNNSQPASPAYPCAVYDPSYSAATSMGTTYYGARNLSYVFSVTLQVICTNCVSSASYNPQWTGSFGDKSGNQTVAGDCYNGFAFPRTTTGPWSVFWSFHKLGAPGTLEVIVRLDNNQTILFDKSSSGLEASANSTVSGSFVFSS